MCGRHVAILMMSNVMKKWEGLAVRAEMEGAGAGGDRGNSPLGFGSQFKNSFK